jgi:hypothetical protein
MDRFPSTEERYSRHGRVEIVAKMSLLGLKWASKRAFLGLWGVVSFLKTN